MTYWKFWRDDRMMRELIRQMCGMAGTMLIVMVCAAFQAAQAQTIRAKSSAQIVGVLPNGMRYYIRANAVPAQRANLWLAVNAGSIQEDDDQRGFAHFLEHMAFNGTRRFPGNTLIDVIEQAGMTFGADLNAYTSFDETVYQLTIPTDDSLLLRQGFHILEDWANNGILVDSLSVVAERGVVLGEWRMRTPDSAGQRVQHESLQRLFGSTSRYVDRFPIGLPDLLRNANPAPLKRFYRDWYRPDLMAVIAVGDFDARAVERQIQRRFGHIPPARTPRAFSRPQVPVADTTIVQVIRDKVDPLVEMTWAAPSRSGDSDDIIRQALMEELFFPYVQRLATIASKQERRPFVVSGAGRMPGMIRPMGARYVIRIMAAPDSLIYGFSALLTEVERVAQHGLPATVLETEKAAILRRYEHEAAEADATSSTVFAERYKEHFLSGEGVLMGSAQLLERVQQLLPAITSEELAAFAARWREASRRIVRVQIPFGAAVPNMSVSEILQLLNSTERSILESGPAPLFTLSKGGVSVGVRAADRVDVPPGTSGGASATSAGSGSSARPLLTATHSGTITSAETNSAIGVTTWTLSNGARVVLKPMMNNPDGVTMHAYSEGGHSLLPDSLFYSSGRLVTMLMTAAGSLGNHQRDIIEQQLRASGVRQFRVSLNAFDEEVLVGGSPRDLETMFQLLYLQFTAPTVDTIRLAEWRRTGARSLYGSVNDQLAAQIGQYPRLSLPQAVNVPFIDLEQAMRVYRHRFGDASDFTFYIVGAVDSARVRPLVERYLAGLPATQRTAREKPKLLSVPLPGEPLVSEARHPDMSAERAQMSVMFMGATPGDSAAHLLERQKAEMVSLILSRRLRNRLREQMAVTYSVSAPVVFYRTPDPRYAITITLLTAPDAMERSRDAVWEEINALRSDGPSGAEIQIATTIMQRQLENARQNDAWWVSQLEGYDRLGVSYDRLATVDVPVFTTKELKQATEYYLSDIYRELTLFPTIETLEQQKRSAKKGGG